MKVSVKNLEGLKREVTVSIPAEKITEEMDLRLKKLAVNAEMSGFRKGKVPLSVLKSKYNKALLSEVASEMIQPTLFKAIEQEGLNPAGYPEVNLNTLEEGKEFSYTALVEILPTVEIKELDKEKVEIIDSKVKAKDVDALLEKLREQNKEWSEVSRDVKDGDKVIIDFEGFIDGVAFEGGKAEDFEVVVGSKSMIPGFEDSLVGAKPDSEFEIKSTFPKEYHKEDLAGKEATFKIKMKKIFEGSLPELNEAFAEKFNVKEGGIEALKKDITLNMERELENRVNSINRGNIFDKLLEKNPLELPSSLVEEEIKILKHEWFHKLFGPEHRDDEKIPDFPREMFEKPAQRRIHLGLLFSEYVKKHSLSVEQEKVDAKINKMAEAYESPQELKDYYMQNKEKMAEVEALVMEEMVAEKILDDATVVNKKMDYEAVMNLQENQQGAN